MSTPTSYRSTQSHPGEHERLSKTHLHVIALALLALLAVLLVAGSVIVASSQPSTGSIAVTPEAFASFDR